MILFVKPVLGRPKSVIYSRGRPHYQQGVHMPWIILAIAGLFEVLWALMLKQSEGFTKPIPTILFLVALFLSMFLLAQSLKTLPVGTAYAVWTGIGAIGTAIFGMVWLGESRDILKLFSILMIVIGIMGLRVAAAHT